MLLQLVMVTMAMMICGDGANGNDDGDDIVMVHKEGGGT